MTPTPDTPAELLARCAALPDEPLTYTLTCVRCGGTDTMTHPRAVWAALPISLVVDRAILHRGCATWAELWALTIP
jgi:hypothetical protein